MEAIRLSRNQLDAIQLALSEKGSLRLFGWLDALLPEKVSWNNQLRIWGDEKTDDVQVSFQDGSIEFVQFRLNVGELQFSLVHGICSIARELDCDLASQEGAIVQPTSGAIVRAVLQSPAARFVRDPKAFLDAVLLNDTTEG